MAAMEREVEHCCWGRTGALRQGTISVGEGASEGEEAVAKLLGNSYLY